MSMERHIADGESSFVVLNVTPDFCKVGKNVVPFDICQTLQPEEADYARSVYARSEPVILITSMIDRVQGNAGSGLASGVSLGAGHTKVVEGYGTVLIESRMAARHDDLAEMNGKVIMAQDKPGQDKPRVPPVASGGKAPVSPGFTGNKTIGRIKTLQCSRDDAASGAQAAALE